ncbi:MAG TPA: HEAT repeat domain-containing protein [Allosphingosinicella sp.]
MLLIDNPKLSILLALTTPDALAEKRRSRNGPASITFSGQRSIFRFLKPGGAVVSFWEAPPIAEGFTAEANARCRKTGERRIADGETIRVDGRSQSFVIEHAVSDMVYVQAVTTAGAAPVSVEYDADSSSLAGASSTDEIGSRIQMMVSLLRLLDRRDAAPVIRKCLASPHFYVRWHVMREFLALDADLALPSLREMAESDPHPEVRAAATQTLAAFFSGEQDASNREDDLCRA